MDEIDASTTHLDGERTQEEMKTGPKDPKRCGMIGQEHRHMGGREA